MWNRALGLTLLLSSSVWALPRIDALFVGNEKRWEQGQESPARLRAGELVTIMGAGFGKGPKAEFSKLLFGKSRALERDLYMYRGRVKVIEQTFYESPRPFDSWKSDIHSWEDTRVVARVPDTASEGPLVVSVQAHEGKLSSIENPAVAHTVSDPLTERITESPFSHAREPVWLLSDATRSNPVPLVIENAEFDRSVSRGEAIYWAYDFNVGLVHGLKGLDWEKVLSGKLTDPFTGNLVDPQALFGSFPLTAGILPPVAKTKHYFNEFPSPMPVRSPLRPPLTRGWSYPSGRVGRVFVESIHPFTGLKTRWIGDNCASCHALPIRYEAAPGKYETRFFAGLPNPYWSEKWSVLGRLDGVRVNEVGPDGSRQWVDKSQILYHIPTAATENALIRESGDGSRYANDYLFAPVVIPTITRHTPLRRVLSRTEMIAGFEGSYIHAQEPDGAIGAMRSSALKDLTAYMTTLDRDDVLLSRLAVYRWVKSQGWDHEIGGAGEHEFTQKGWEMYPLLAKRVEEGRQSFAVSCQRCHEDNFGTFTDERMFGLTEVGSYFSPSIFHRETQSIRTSYLRNLYWIEKRGLLHDGHVKSMADLVNPDRCKDGTALYSHYYRLSPSTFHIPKGDEAEERALRRHAYFMDVAWDEKSLYWDYQKMRREFGVREFGLSQPAGLPSAPHPWCAGSSDTVNLVTYLYTL